MASPTATVDSCRYSLLIDFRFGETVYRELSKKLEAPVIFDFKGATSLGSSFGDEVIPPFARAQGGSVEVRNVNKAIHRVLENVAEDAEIELRFGG